MKRWLSDKKWRVIISGLVVTAIPIIGLALFVSLEIAGYLRNDVMKEVQQTAIFISEQIKDSLDDEIRLGKLLASRPLLKRAIKHADRKEMEVHLKDFIDNSLTIERVFLTDRKGILIADYPSDPSVLNNDLSQRDWYKGISNNWLPYISEFYRRAAKPRRYLFAIAIPVKADDYGSTGILVLQPTENYLKSVISRLPHEKNQTTYVVDKKGNLICHSGCVVDRAIDLSGFPAIQKVRKGLTGVETFLNPDGQRMLTAYRSIEGYGWGVVVERPEKEVFRPVKDMIFVLLFFASIMLLTGGYFAYKRSALINSLQKFAEELERRVEERTDELATAYAVLQSEVAERNLAEESLRESEKKLKDITSSLAEGIYVVDEKGHVIFMNPEAERLLGWTTAELMDKNAHDIVHCRKKNCSLLSSGECNILDVVRTGIPFVSRDEFFIRKDGTSFPISVVSSPIVENGKVVAAVTAFRDITERKQVEIALKETMDNLVAANKELEAFSYSVSHDLRAPLRQMSGFVKLLEKRSSDHFDSKGRDYMAAIVQTSKKMEMLIDDLLSFSRMGRAEMQNMKINFNTIVKSTVREMQSEVKRRDIKWEIDELPDVYGDQSMLKLALVNLISNAIKYTSTRTRAEIRIGYKEGEDEFIFFVKDNGVGFDMKYADRLFGVFQRLHTSDEFEGTGIGLANVRRIISRHGGRTWAEGSLDQGATFYFTLPKTKEA